MATRKRKSGEGAPSTSLQLSKKVKLDDMQSWVSSLDLSLNKNTTEYSVLSKIFGDKLLVSIRKHELFWPKLIGSIVCGIRHRPETTMCWINFHLLNFINQGKLKLPTAADLYSYLQPFIRIKNLFQMFISHDESPNVDYYHLYFEPASPGKCASISITSRNHQNDIIIARITKQSASEVVRNTCLLSTLLISLCEDNSRVRELITFADAEILKFLTSAVMKIKKVTVESTQPLNDANNNANLDGPQQSQSKLPFHNSLEQIQTANFSLLAFMQCFDELPNDDEPFSDLLSQEVKSHLSEIASENATDVIMGRVESWPRNKLQFATLVFQVLVHRTLGKIASQDSTILVACSDGMNPCSWGRWVFGNYSLAHQTYQFHLSKSSVHKAKYYAELRPLTPGPLKVGFAPSVENLDERSQNLSEIPGSICYDYYENGLWIYQKEYIPKITESSNATSTFPVTADSMAFPGGRDQVVIGVLLNTEAEDELEAVRFFVNGHEVNSMMDVSMDVIQKSSTKQWKDPSQFLLSVAPVAYQQAILVLNREYWKYNRDNDELIAFEKLAVEVHNDNVGDDENGQQDGHKTSNENSFNDALSAPESDLFDLQDIQDIDNIEDFEAEPLGLRDLDWAEDYDTSFYD